MAASAKNPRDFTGREREKLLNEHAAELAARADEISLNNAAEAKRLANEIVDVTNGTPTIIDDVENLGVSTADDSVILRVNTDIEQMTFGAGTNYDFKVGAKYRVSRDLFNHLEELGYVWH